MAKIHEKYKQDSMYTLWRMFLISSRIAFFVSA